MNLKHPICTLISFAVALTSLSACAIAPVDTSLVVSQTTDSAKPTQRERHDRMNHGDMKHDMDLGNADANYDLRFIDSMVVHHQGGVVMSKEVLAKSKRPELIKLAKNIISAQDREISQMQQWRKSWYPKTSATPIMWHASMNHEMPMTDEYQKMMRMDMSLGKADTKFDLRFLKAMIAHHQGAIEMAQDVFKKSQRTQMQTLAKNIITTQQQEVDMMKKWQKAWYADR